MKNGICNLDYFISSSFGFDRVFKNPQVLKESYIPEKFLFRDKEREEILREIATYFQMSMTPNDIYINGPTSTGKTHMIKRMMIEINEYSRKLDEKLELIYSSFKSKTCVGGLAELVQKYINPKVSQKSNFETLINHISEYAKDKVLGIILDEVDKMRATCRIDKPIPTLIGSIIRLHELRDIDRDHYFMIVITNEDIIKLLPSTDKSSFTPNTIYFRDYNEGEIREIIKDRCNLAFKDGIVTDDAIAYLSKLIKNKMGNLRVGFKTLLNAGKIAIRKNCKVTEDVIDEAFDMLQRNIIEEKLVNADDTTLLIVYATAKIQKLNGEATMTSVYELYKQNESKPLSFGYVSNYIIPKLESEGLLKTKIRGLGRGKGKARFLEVEADKIDNIITICEEELKRRWL